jgi:hypothetical protein
MMHSRKSYLVSHGLDGMLFVQECGQVPWRYSNNDTIPATTTAGEKRMFLPPAD